MLSPVDPLFVLTQGCQQQGYQQAQAQARGKGYQQGKGQGSQWQQSQGKHGQGQHGQQHQHQQQQQQQHQHQQKPKGAVDGRMLSGQISQAGGTRELLCLSTTHSASLNHIHVANLWNKLGKQRDASGRSYKEEVRRLLRRTGELMDSCGARELSNIAHGLAKCRLVGTLLYTTVHYCTLLYAATAHCCTRTLLHTTAPVHYCTLLYDTAGSWD